VKIAIFDEEWEYSIAIFGRKKGKSSKRRQRENEDYHKQKGEYQGKFKS